MLMRFVKSSNSRQKETEITLYAGKITIISRALQMKTCRGVFDDCVIDIVFALFSRRKSLEQQSKLPVESCLEIVIFALFHERLGGIVEAESFTHTCAIHFDNASA